MNLPTGGIAALVLFIFLNLNPHHGRPLKQHINEFDFIGLLLIVSGVVCLLLGFNFSETSCKFHQSFYIAPLMLLAGQEPQTITLVTIGGVLLVCAGVNEVYTKRSPIIPPRLFKVRSYFSAILISPYWLSRRAQRR